MGMSQNELLLDIPQGFSRSEIFLMLNRVRSRCGKPPVGESTFYRWCDELSITPKFRYSEFEAKRLTRLCLHYATGGKSTNVPAI
jgi:hypothetical protein